eukprot:1744958-Karenia_brevis.AAC.1
MAAEGRKGLPWHWPHDAMPSNCNTRGHGHTGLAYWCKGWDWQAPALEAIQLGKLTWPQGVWTQDPP